MAGAKNEAKIKFTAETHEFNTAIQQATSAMKELRAALALNATEMKNGGDQTQNLIQRYTMLKNQYDEQGRVVENLYQKLQVAREIYGENSTQVAEYSAKLFQAENAQMKLGQQINECVAEIDRMVNSTGTGQSAYAKMTTTISQQQTELQKLKQQYVEVALAHGKDSTEAQQLAAQIDALSGELKENQTALSDAQQSADSYDQTLQETAQNAGSVQTALDSLHGAFTKVDGVVTSLVQRGFRELVSATKEIAKNVLDTGMKTETSFAKVSAVMQTTDSDMAMLKDRALEVQQGMNPLPYTLNDCATAYYYMGLAGWNANQSAEALYPTLSLVTASGEDLADVSDIVTDNITAFGLTSKDTQMMCDVLAQTMRSTNTDVGLLGQTFKYAAAPAHAAGYSLQDVALAAGLMANNGIKGSQAGTSLRQAFNALAKPSEAASAMMEKYNISLTDGEGNMYTLKGLMDQLRVAFAGISVDVTDAEGNLRDYDDIMADLEGTTNSQAAAEKLRAAYTIFGARATSGMLSIINMEESEYQRVTAAIYDYDGACEEMARIMNDNLTGDLKMLNTSLDTLANRLYDNASPALRSFVQELTGWVQSDQSVALIDQISGELTKLAHGVLWDLPNIIKNISTILQGIPTAISAVGSAISFITSHINGITTALKAILVTWAAIKAVNFAGQVGSVALNIVGLIAHVVSLTGVTQAATVAQWAFNAAMNANVVGIVVMGIVGLVAGLAALIKHFQNASSNAVQCNARIQALVSTITPFRDGVNNLTSAWKLNDEQMRRITTIDEEVAQGEQRITAAIQKAVADHGTLRENEIAQYENAVARFKELEAERLAIYREGVTNIGYEIEASIQQVGGMTQQEMLQYTVDLEAALKSANEAVDASCQAEIERINEYYKARGEQGSQAHLQELAAAKAAAAEEKAVNQQGYAEKLALLTNYAAQSVAGDMQMWNQLYANSNRGREQYTSNLEQMDLDAAEAFLSMWASAKKAGVDIPAETDQMAMGILNSFENLPPKLQEQGKAVLDGLIGGMENSIPRLQYASDATCNEIVGAIKQDLQINSPSRVMMEIGANVVQGLAEGMGQGGSAINTAATNIAKTIIQGLTPQQGTANAIGQQTASNVAGGLSSGTGSVTGAAKAIGAAVSKSIAPDAAAARSAGATTVQQEQAGIQSGTGSISAAAKAIGTVVGKTIVPDAGAAHTAGANTVAQEQSGIQSKTSAISGAAKAIGQAVGKSIVPDAGAARTAGANTVAQEQSGIQSKNGAISGTAKSMAQNVVKSLTPNAGSVKSVGANTIAQDQSGIQSKTSAISSAAKSLAQNVVKSLTPNAGSVKTVGVNTIVQDQSGIQSKASAINSAAKTLAQNVVKSLTPNAGSVKTVGANTIAQDQAGMQSKSGAINNTAKTLAQNTVKSLTPNASSVRGVGSNIVSGVNEGIQSKSSWLGSRIASFASDMVSHLKDAFKIGSPSRVMADEIGQWIPAGIGMGIEDNSQAAVQPLISLVNSMTGQSLGLDGLNNDIMFDINSRISGHMEDAFENNTQLSMLDRMNEMIERLANVEFIVNMDINGQRFARATATASDEVSGTRLNLRERGLAL